MTVLATGPGGALVVKTIDLITAALQEINVTGAGQVASAEDSEWGLQKLQRIVDLFNAKRALISGVSFARFTLIANHPIHTIGPKGDFDLPQRPVSIASWALILAGGTEIDLTHSAVRDDDWWAGVGPKGLTSNLPTDLYYSADSPLGSCYFWPVPTVARDVRLELWANLSMPLTMQTILAMPPGYWDALVTTLAVRLCPSFSKAVPPDLREDQRQAIQAIESNNLKSPRTSTCDFGMPRGRRYSSGGMGGGIILGGGGGGLQPIGLTGAIDGVNRTFTANASVSAVHELFADGVKLVRNNNDGYTLTGFTFTLAHPPVSTIELLG